MLIYSTDSEKTKVCDSLTWAYFLYPVSKCRLDVEVNYWKHKLDFIFARRGWRANVPSLLPRFEYTNSQSNVYLPDTLFPPFFSPHPLSLHPWCFGFAEIDWLLRCKIKMAVSSRISWAGFYFPQGHRSLELFGLFGLFYICQCSSS